MREGFNRMGVKLSYLNWIDASGASLVADSETTDLTADNVATSLSYLVWRTVFSSDTAAGISIDLGEVREIGVVAVQFRRTNIAGIDERTYFASTDTIRIRLSADTPDAGEILDTGVVASGCLTGYGTYANWLSTAVNARYMRIDFDAISQASAGFLDIPRIWAGPVLAPRVNVSWGLNTLWQSNSPVLQSSRGTAVFVAQLESLRVWSFTWDWLDATMEAPLVEDFERRINTSGEFLITDTDKPAGRGDMFAYASNTNGLTASRYGIVTKQMRIQENI